MKREAEVQRVFSDIAQSLYEEEQWALFLRLQAWLLSTSDRPGDNEGLSALQHNPNSLLPT